MADPTLTNDATAGNVQVDDDHTELFLAIAALVISIAAFFVSILQALQQYYSSARGYSSCGPAVIGKWAAFRHRIFRWYEFRFEVTFEVPVIFVARPSNTRGPMGPTEKSKITVLDGSPESYRDSHTRDKVERDREFDMNIRNSARVLTADNEAATWLDLLVAIVSMEEESRRWQGKALKSHTGGVLHSEEQRQGWSWPPTEAGGHTISVCIQKKTKSWDTVPDHVTKPYATTTIAHLVELTAMLGIYWKVFDRGNDRYLAQGNGFILSGSNVDGLGLTFSFLKKGPAHFEAGRVVPSYPVKELCFGLCPTTFRLPGDKLLADEVKDIGTLQLGSMEEIAGTLVILGCNARNVNYFRDTETKSRYGHLFPVAFELLGMVGIVFQVKGTVFRTLPNPTVFRWEPNSFDLSELLHEYGESFKTLNLAPADEKEKSLDIMSLLETIQEKFREWKAMRAVEVAPQDQKPTLQTPSATARDIEGQSQTAGVTRRGWLPKTLSSMTTTSMKTVSQPKKAEEPLEPQAIYSPALFEALHTAIEACDAFLEPRENREPSDSLLRLVLRSHLQAVLEMVNGEPLEREDVPEDGPTGHTIRDLDAASDRKHAMLMEMYFGSVRENVIGRVQRRQKSREGVDKKALKRELNEIWCALVFRMICWLLLHHFHEKDVQVEKSDVFESRLPVYIV